MDGKHGSSPCLLMSSWISDFQSSQPAGRSVLKKRLQFHFVANLIAEASTRRAVLCVTGWYRNLQCSALCVSPEILVRGSLPLYFREAGCLRHCKTFCYTETFSLQQERLTAWLINSILHSSVTLAFTSLLVCHFLMCDRFVCRFSDAVVHRHLPVETNPKLGKTIQSVRTAEEAFDSAEKLHRTRLVNTARGEQRWVTREPRVHNENCNKKSGPSQCWRYKEMYDTNSCVCTASVCRFGGKMEHVQLTYRYSVTTRPVVEVKSLPMCSQLSSRTRLRCSGLLEYISSYYLYTKGKSANTGTGASIGIFFKKCFTSRRHIEGRKQYVLNIGEVRTTVEQDGDILRGAKDGFQDYFRGAGWWLAVLIHFVDGEISEQVQL